MSMIKNNTPKMKLYQVSFDDGSTAFMQASDIAIKTDLSIQEVLVLYANETFVLINMEEQEEIVLPRPVYPVYEDVLVPVRVMTERVVAYETYEETKTYEFEGLFSYKVIEIIRLRPVIRYHTLVFEEIQYRTEYRRIK